MVTAYSETDFYGEGPYYYQATVELWSNGQYAFGQSPNPSYLSASATITYQGSAGNTYTATGEHTAYISTKFFGGLLNDPYGLEEWAAYGIDDPWEYPFAAFGPETSPEATMPLGDTYDSAMVTIPAKCGDIRDTIIGEYETYGTPHWPQCSEFSNSGSSEYFTFANLNTGNYSWAILEPYFYEKMDALWTLQTFTINSAYRNPAREYAAATSNGGRYALGSRHQYGDAVDVATNSLSTWQPYANNGHTLGGCVEPFSVQRNYNHAHIDWRTLATTGQTWSRCPNGW